MARQSALRASDADRDAVAERLGAAVVEGRLDADELEQRLHVALRARTYGELQHLLDDLPGARRPWHGRGRLSARSTTDVAVLAVRLVAFLIVATIAIALTVLAAAVWLVCALTWLVIRGHHRRHARPRHLRGTRRAASYYVRT